MIFNNPIFAQGKFSNSNKNQNNISLQKENIKFIFYDLTSSTYDKNLILSLSPSILNNVPKSNKTYTLRAPYGITEEDLKNFLYIYSNISFRHNSKFIGKNIKKLFSLLKLMDYFGNEKFNIQIISKIIIPELNSDIAVELIIFSYDKLCFLNEMKKEANNIYFELFYQSLEELSKDESIIIKNIDKLKTLDAKIVEELVQKTFRKLIFSNYYIEKKESKNNNNINNNIEDEQDLNNIDENNYFDDNDIGSIDFNQWHRKDQIQAEKKKKIDIQNLQILINLLIQINNLDNIFSLLTREYMYLLSSESIQELINLPNPNFQTKIPISSYENFYDEFPLDININNQLLTLVIFYKNGDKSINACIKLSKNKKNNSKNIKEEHNENKYHFEILTFLTSVKVTRGFDKNNVISIQNNLTSLTNNKSLYSILKIPHFDSYQKTFISDNNNNNNPKKSEDFFLLSLRISLCDIYSVVASYLLHDYYNYINDKNISKLTKQLFIILIKNKKLNKKNENNLIKSILLWLDDEINIKEDISEIFYLIKWEEVDDDLIFELLLKYSHFILNDISLENLFLEIYINKFNKSNNVKLIFKRIFQAIKKIEYNKLFVKISRNEKILENYKNRDWGVKKNWKKEKICEIEIKNDDGCCKNKNEILFRDEYSQTEISEENKKNKKYGRNIMEIKNKSIKNKKCFWNITQMKNFISNKNSPKKLIPSNSNKKNKIKDNSEKRPKSNSNKITSRNNIYNSINLKNNNIKRNIRNNNNSVKQRNIKKENYKFNSSIQSSNSKINLKKNSKNNISLIKKSQNNKGKIKEMQIFPINFSSLKRFQSTNKKENKNNKTYEENKNKSNNNNAYEENNDKKNYEKNRYHSERTSDKKNGNKYISRIYSEKKIKISVGIVKEICFMNNT